MDSTTRYGLWIECITVRIENNLTTAEISSDLSTTRSYIVKSFDCSLYNKGWRELLLTLIDKEDKHIIFAWIFLIWPEICILIFY